MGQMREKMLAKMKTCGVAENTQRTYMSAMKMYVRHYNQSPEKLSVEEIQKYHLYLIEERKLCAASVNVHMGAIKFFYQMCLKKEFQYGDIPKLKEIKKVPIVLSQEEICKLLGVITNIKHKALVAMLYASGLRSFEALELKAEDILSDRMLIYVRRGKGGKNRYTLLSHALLKLLRQYWVENKNDKSQWLFPGQAATEPMSYSGLRTVFQKAKKKAGLTTKASVHNLRHSFATHLLEMGTDIRIIQDLLGHATLNSTMIYTRVARTRLSDIRNPLDAINEKVNLI